MTAGTQSGSDLRRVPRARTVLGGRALFNEGRSVIDCQVRDLSEKGARLQLSDALALPGTFDLEIPARQSLWRVALRWRSQEKAGVEFLENLAAPPDGPDDAFNLLRRENAILRKRVAELVHRLSELGYSEWQK